MSKLHELLAVEKTVVNASNKLQAETSEKFGKDHYFKGYVKSLKMIEDTPENTVLERSSSEIRELPTNVYETLEYMLDIWAKAEDVIFQKNKSNMIAVSQINFRGTIIAENVPVDELMGLEVRLENLRKIFDRIPTHDATKSWKLASDKGKGVWVSSNDEITTKTEKRMVPIILHEATKEHPAQVKESTKDEIIGYWSTVNFTGSITSAAKAEIISITDELIKEVKMARTRANSVEACSDKIGKDIVRLLLSPLTK